MRVIGSTPIASLERLNVQLFHLKETPRALRRLPFIILAPIKVTLQALTVLHALLLAIPHPPEYIVVQVRYVNCNVTDTAADNCMNEARIRRVYLLLRFSLSSVL